MRRDIFLELLECTHVRGFSSVSNPPHLAPANSEILGALPHSASASVRQIAMPGGKRKIESMQAESLKLGACHIDVPFLKMLGKTCRKLIRDPVWGRKTWKQVVENNIKKGYTGCTSGCQLPSSELYLGGVVRHPCRWAEIPDFH